MPLILNNSSVVMLLLSEFASSDENKKIVIENTSYITAIWTVPGCHYIPLLVRTASRCHCYVTRLYTLLRLMFLSCFLYISSLTSYLYMTAIQGDTVTNRSSCGWILWRSWHWWLGCPNLGEGNQQAWCQLIGSTFYSNILELLLDIYILWNSVFSFFFSVFPFKTIITYQLCLFGNLLLERHTQRFRLCWKLLENTIVLILYVCALVYSATWINIISRVLGFGHDSSNLIGRFEESIYKIWSIWLHCSGWMPPSQW